jgi:plasmid maintenance system antidote protein VapI
MYPNLRAEMARYNLKTKDLERVLKLTNKSVNNKLSGKTPFTIPEAVIIRDKLFPKKTIDDLFSESVE